MPDHRLFPEAIRTPRFSTLVLLSSFRTSSSIFFFYISQFIRFASPPVIPTIHQFRIDGSRSSTLFTVVSSRPLPSPRGIALSHSDDSLGFPRSNFRTWCHCSHKSACRINFQSVPRSFNTANPRLTTTIIRDSLWTQSKKLIDITRKRF